MILLDGKKLAEEVKLEIKKEVDAMIEKGQRAPHLAAILVGDNPASKAYVSTKIKFCEDVGYGSTLITLPGDTSEDALLEEVQKLNDNDQIDGYIVQLPLPRHIDEQKINLAILPAKDVDGFHPMNFGKMAQGMDAFLPATPYGILEMLRRYQIPTEGKHCVVLGRSNIVGGPMSILMARKGYPGNCTVTLVHSKTINLPEELRRADIIIAAIGIPHFVKADMVREGAVVIDVGINRVEDKNKKSGYSLTGDVDFEGLKEKCSYLSPVPGGVGPMTVTALMLNTLRSAQQLV
ncbi:MAG: bifunctional 5,10-methylenetetrahydrofolate dehydrogenase/5,10-methenyltetrahydrofolate cyclohydrolase [Saprospiraceae bacterium]|jgi:methylenetetrahydrofolate dehydrogenase (NADP+)/methenyltetrahydrofolate cyclohydrolase|nr:bifunctional 5,10-methylenetetrahydrofolate dehydrogenase/5,10-methenyltetrahydrofolate cyclohydrolase [Saprospiraceae bacterium]MBP9194225.1 bifunctional 5,10-methylenetetrahydrofolate dehydrogenase/5,10-methenyltetrahydrofolate cyclohydrolase [Saprospiraceae bacterium]